MLQSIFHIITVIATTIVSFLFPFAVSTNVTYEATSTAPAQTHIATTAIPTRQNPAPTTKASTTPIKKVTKPATNTGVAVITPTQTIKTPSPAQSAPTISFEQINDNARKSVVNILCGATSGNPFSGASGSGVIISSDGVVVTNAHLGQYFLLKDFNGQKNSVQCTIRVGSPAYPTYKAELVYLSPQWVQKNADVLVEQNPQGTGQYDYAFLKIISKVDGSAVTTPLPYLPINLNENVNTGNNILLASYPAEFLGGINIQKDLYQTSAITQISKLFTFGADTVDVISIPGTVVSQKGSSGGAAVNSLGELTGIITTSSAATTTGERDLKAITLAYINRDLTANAHINLKTILDNPQATSDLFNQTIAGTLTTVLTNAILNK